MYTYELIKTHALSRYSYNLNHYNNKHRESLYYTPVEVDNNLIIFKDFLVKNSRINFKNKIINIMEKLKI